MKSVFCLAVLAVAAFPSSAAGDGLPLVDLGPRPEGITAADGSVRFNAVPTRGGTMVLRVAADGGRVLRSRFVAGRWAVPAVAYDGTAGGLSADGQTLALIKPRRAFPRARTALTLFDASLRVRSRVRLRGDFSFDAIAPDGSALFLVEYPNRRNPQIYRVRVYDVAGGRLLRKPLLDSRIATVVMRGLPITRASDGRRAYTLYDGFGDPFIHALDTHDRSALCILLPDVEDARDPMSLSLALSGTTLSVRDASGSPVELVDTATSRAWAPATGGLFGVLREITSDVRYAA